MDAGTLAEGGRKHQPGSPAYAADLPQALCARASQPETSCARASQPESADRRHQERGGGSPARHPACATPRHGRALPADHASGRIRNRFRSFPGGATLASPPRGLRPTCASSGVARSARPMAESPTSAGPSSSRRETLRWSCPESAGGSLVRSSPSSARSKKPVTRCSYSSGRDSNPPTCPASGISHSVFGAVPLGRSRRSAPRCRRRGRRRSGTWGEARSAAPGR